MSAPELLRRVSAGGGRALALIDGEHYAPVVRDALGELPYDVAVALLVGGSEKLRDGADYGVPLVDTLEEAGEHDVDVVVDLSDEPVLGPRERFLLASRALALGLTYVGADFALAPPEYEPFARPSVAVVGTGKRVGKTAVTTYVARLFSADRRVIVVAMGRGGPAEPDVIEEPPDAARLVELARAGQHAASDYLEIAALAGVSAVGCRRCGGGLAGATATSTVPAGARAALELEPDLVIFDGSGAALPPIATDKRVLVVNAHQDPAVATGYLNAYRILVSDLVVLTMAEDGSGHEELARAIAQVKPGVPVVATLMRPRPVEPVEGKRVAYFTTAPADAHERLAHYLRSEHGADVVHVSGNLARRAELREELEPIDAEAYLVEIKAAGIDVVADWALERGAAVVFVDNELVPLRGQPNLDDELRALAEASESTAVSS